MARSLIRIAALALSMLALGCGSPEQLAPAPVRAELMDTVDPFIGTGGIGFGVGSTYPAAALPFAMIHLGPDTTGPTGAATFSHCAGYSYEDDLIEGFSLTRMNGTGEPDYGTMALMAADGMSDERRDEQGYRAPFDHAAEHAEPGYYRVELDNHIELEITTSLRSAIMRVRFPDGTDPVVLLDAEHTIGTGTSAGGEVRIEPATGALSAFMHNDGDMSNRFGGFEVFMHAAFDPLPERHGVWDEQGLHQGERSARGVDIGGWFGFTPGTREVQVRLGMSFVDDEGARANLAAEIPTFDFEAVRRAASARWAEELATLEIWGADDALGTAIASARYRAVLMPTLMSDVDGRAPDVNGHIIFSEHPRYSDFSLWDTYRTLHPWLVLGEDAHNVDLMASLVAMAREGGAVPRWALARSDVHSMIGSPGEIVLAGAAAKGVPFDDEREAYALARVAAFGPPPGDVGGRGAIEPYLSYGYVPSDLDGGSVSKTQEYAIADAALGAWAARLGEQQDAAELSEHANSWRQLYDKQEGFFRGKRRDGSWEPWLGPLGGGDVFVEGDGWQYLWLVPQDLEGLGELLGGEQAARERLEQLFTASAAETPVIGMRRYYWHGNEPDLMAPWLFAAWGDRNRTADWVRWTISTFYGTGPDGLAGNDDGGTLSAWLLFAACGIYPIAGFDRYIVGAPLLPRVVLHRPDGDLHIEGEPDPRRYPHVAAVTLDGVSIVGPYVRHQQLVGDHLLHFAMTR